MNKLMYETPKTHNSVCADVVTMAEHEFAAFFIAMTELYGPEEAELSAEDWLGELKAISPLPSSTHEWRRITLNVSTRVAARVTSQTPA